MSNVWTSARWEEIFSILETDQRLSNAPVVHFMSKVGDGAFKILISTILSLRTKDEVTGPASQRLFSQAYTPEQILELSLNDIETLIYPVGFYKNKARQIKKICAILVDKYCSQVPDDLDLLLELPGVGRKTANLVLSVAFNIPAVCVDIHVHRISNRLGFCDTKTPEQTEFYIRSHISQNLWTRFNRILVALGQVVCRPISPKCQQCSINFYCQKKIKKS
ncbi:MAG: endonuclease III domain-containing protein [Brevinemataceae bacterium]